MRKFITFLIVLIACTAMQAQSTAYLGVSLGYATPGGESMDGVENGVDFGFIHAGYRFTENWGVVLNLNSSGHIIENTNNELAVGVAYWGVGAMYTLPINNNMYMDIKPQIAPLMVAVYADDSGAVDDLTWKGSGFVLGNSLVFGGDRRFAFSINLDYLAGKWTEVEVLGETIDVDENNDVSLFKLGVGVRYNF
jgi:hypothetical protein